jgi:transposase
MGQITVFSGPERRWRWRWSDEAQLQILTEAFSPGACVAQVCRRHDISTGLIYTWRRKFREAQAYTTSGMLPVPSFAEAGCFAHARRKFFELGDEVIEPIYIRSKKRTIMQFLS